MDQDSYDLLDKSHSDAVEARNRFGTDFYGSEEWDLVHLRPYAFKQKITLKSAELEVYVVVIFSCHCFTRGIEHGDKENLYFDEKERRALCPDRYQLSKDLLPQMVHELSKREIKTTGSDTGNYMTLELVSSDGISQPYIVFFEVSRDLKRKKRVILRVQSAHIRDTLSQRMKEGRKVNFQVLVRAAYEGKKIR